jgi:sugar phosphate isomerase/epimerase
VQQILSLQAAEGMVLAKEVMTAEGRVLCGKGTVLTGTIIERIRKMGIGNITVEGHPVPVEGEKSLEEELRDVEERFSRVKHVPPLMYVKKKIMQRKVASRKAS